MSVASRCPLGIFRLVRTNADPMKSRQEIETSEETSGDVGVGLGSCLLYWLAFRPQLRPSEST